MSHVKHVTIYIHVCESWTVPNECIECVFSLYWWCIDMMEGEGERCSISRDSCKHEPQKTEKMTQILKMIHRVERVECEIWNVDLIRVNLYHLTKWLLLCFVNVINCVSLLVSSARILLLELNWKLMVMLKESNSVPKKGEEMYLINRMHKIYNFLCIKMTDDESCDTKPKNLCMPLPSYRIISLHSQCVPWYLYFVHIIHNMNFISFWCESNFSFVHTKWNIQNT